MCWLASWQTFVRAVETVDFQHNSLCRDSNKHNILCPHLEHKKLMGCVGGSSAACAMMSQTGRQAAEVPAYRSQVRILEASSGGLPES